MKNPLMVPEQKSERHIGVPKIRQDQSQKPTISVQYEMNIDYDDYDIRQYTWYLNGSKIWYAVC